MSACECGGQRTTSDVPQTPSTFFWDRVSCRSGTHQVDQAGQPMTPPWISVATWDYKWVLPCPALFIWALRIKVLHQISYHPSLDFKLLTEFENLIQTRIFMSQHPVFLNIFPLGSEHYFLMPWEYSIIIIMLANLQKRILQQTLWSHIVWQVKTWI